MCSRMMTRLLMLLIIGCLLLPACAGRQPTLARSTALVQRHFHKYGKKFPDSLFGQHKVSKLAVLHVQEIHKYYVHVIADLALDHGVIVRVQVAVERRAPTGWRVVAWEQLDQAAAPAASP